MLDRLRSLGKSLTVYGLGDVATSVISFLLLPLYARFLTPADYGAIGLLLSVEVVAKIVFRFGVDASFMRLWVDCADERARQRLASTLFWFLAAADGAVLAACVAATPLARRGDGRDRLRLGAAHRPRQHLRHRLLLHPVPRPAADRPGGDRSSR